LIALSPLQDDHNLGLDALPETRGKKPSTTRHPSAAWRFRSSWKGALEHKQTYNLPRACRQVPTIAKLLRTPTQLSAERTVAGGGIHPRGELRGPTQARKDLPGGMLEGLGMVRETPRFTTGPGGTRIHRIKNPKKSPGPMKIQAPGIDGPLMASFDTWMLVSSARVG
jgi:hypothetical protein